MCINPIISTDSYKVSHYKQYPPCSQFVFSYLESRGGHYDRTVVFDARNYLLKEMLRPITRDDIDEADDFFAAHFGSRDIFNRIGWEYILKRYNGVLPLRIRAVPEGTVVPTRNVLMTVENTDPNVPWLTNYVETNLSRMWYPITVATMSWHIRRNILHYLQRTGTPELIDFKLHDFGDRGVSSEESAAIGGLAHLVNFKGTDTMPALRLARDYYQESMAGFSIPAAEHSTITSWGRENEAKAYRNMLQSYPTRLVAVVSDSYDIYNACERLWGGVLRDEVLQRNGVLVIRPDSGDPLEVLPRVLDILGRCFGATTNQKGYKVLNDKVRVIQGDGVNAQSINDILHRLSHLGWSADNIAFGSGGALLQKHDRDEQKFAFKCSSITINGREQDVYKDPVTDAGKASKRGRITLYRNREDGTLFTDRIGAPVLPADDVMRTVYLNGIMVGNLDCLSTIRQRAAADVHYPVQVL